MVASIETKAAVKQILLDLTPYLDEKQKRILYGSAASVLGHGGITFVNEITGSARNTITSGMDELQYVVFLYTLFYFYLIINSCCSGSGFQPGGSFFRG